MKRKRLNRDKWGFQYFPYNQMRIDQDSFHGLVSLIQLTSGQYFYWDFPLAGKVPVCGEGMVWLQLIPDQQHRVITAMYLPEKKILKGTEYPYRVSVWYTDIIESIDYDPDGVAVFIDKYLDVIFTPCGDVKIDDRDELDAAYDSGELTKKQYNEAIAEGNEIVTELCSNLVETEILCNKILLNVFERISNG